jgi:PAS domain S-box-containing protein
MPDARLLLVVDKKGSRAIQTPLKNLGYQIVGSIPNGSQALERVVELNPDLILIQMNLEGNMDGVQVGNQIFNQYDIPIIYIADQPGQLTLRRSGGTAPFGYLFGQLDEKQILATIEVALTRHSMEKKVRESEGWLNAILHSISEGLIAVDNSQCVRFMNPIAETLIGKTSVDAIGCPIKDVLLLHYANSEEPVTISHAMRFLQNQKLRTGFEASLISNVGTRVPVEVFISPIKDKGKPVGMVMSFRDISDRKRAMLEINRYAMRSEALLKAAEQLNARLNVKEVLSTVCGICNNTLNTTATSAFLYNPSQNTLISITIAVNNKVSDYTFDTQTFSSRLEIPVDLISSVVSNSNPIIAIKDIQVIDLPNIPYLDKIKEMKVHSLAISGMFQGDTLMGILVAQVHGTTHDFTQVELDLLRGLTDQATIAVGNANLFEQVMASRERQQALTRRLVDLQEDERRNLAHELHDHIGQMMTGLQFSLSALLPQATEEQKKSIANAQEQVRSLIAQTREISLNLRPSMLDDTGLTLTLLWHFDRFTSQTNIKVNFQHRNILDKRFESTIETAVFRIIQEALTNVARYADTEEVEVIVQLEEKKIKVEINDQGQGFDLSEVDTLSHVGLSSMRERAFTVGGLLEINSVPGQGTRIQAIIPLEGQVERRQHER